MIRVTREGVVIDWIDRSGVIAAGIAICCGSGRYSYSFGGVAKVEGA